MTLYTLLLAVILVPAIIRIRRGVDHTKLEKIMPKKGSGPFYFLVLCVALSFAGFVFWLDGLHAATAYGGGLREFLKLVTIIIGFTVIGLLFLGRWIFYRFRRNRTNPDEPGSGA